MRTTEIVGGDVPNQESAIGAGTDSSWRWWKVLAGLVACVAVFFGLVFAGFALFASRQ